jgi:hypothetical protein
MEYMRSIKSVVDYITKGYNTAIGKLQGIADSITYSGLELAVVTAQPGNNINPLSKKEELYALQVYFASYDIKSVRQVGDKVIVTRTGDSRDIPLDPSSAKKSPEDYIKKKLGDYGIKPKHAEVTKIANLFHKKKH